MEGQEYFEPGSKTHLRLGLQYVYDHYKLINNLEDRNKQDNQQQFYQAHMFQRSISQCALPAAGYLTTQTTEVTSCSRRRLFVLQHSVVLHHVTYHLQITRCLQRVSSHFLMTPFCRDGLPVFTGMQAAS